MNITSRSLLGRGPSFPMNQSSTGGVKYSDDIDRINHSLFLIFETPKGSRLMLPDFGSDIHKYKFDPLDTVLLERLRYTITEDVKRWEPRIDLTSVEFLTDSSYINESTLYISINYRVINTPIEANYVYPYKLSTYDTVELSNPQERRGNDYV